MSKVRVSFNDLLLRLVLDLGVEESNRLLHWVTVRTNTGGLFKSMSTQGEDFTVQFVKDGGYRVYITPEGRASKIWTVAPEAGTVEVDRITTHGRRLIIWTTGSVLDHNRERAYFPQALNSAQLAQILAERSKSKTEKREVFSGYVGY